MADTRKGRYTGSRRALAQTERDLPDTQQTDQHTLGEKSGIRLGAYHDGLALGALGAELLELVVVDVAQQLLVVVPAEPDEHDPCRRQQIQDERCRGKKVWCRSDGGAFRATRAHAFGGRGASQQEFAGMREGPHGSSHQRGQRER